MYTLKEQIKICMASQQDENLKRGMTEQQANTIIDNFEKQFIKANLYNSDEKLFIEYMRTAIFLHFTSIQITRQ